MDNPLFLLKVLLQEARKRNFIVKSLFFSLLYIVSSLVVINYQTYGSILLSEYPILSKFRILLIILSGSFQVISNLDTILLLVTALLFGINLELVLRKIKFLAGVGNLHVTLGTGLISIAATGCASCGLSLASIAGLSAVLASLPFHGLELYAISIFILLISLFYNLHTFVRACKIERF